MNSFSRQDVLRILQISSRQLQGWERAGLITQRETYTFQDLGQLRTLRSLREEDVSAASIRHSVAAMQAVAGMSNPLQEASLVRTGTRLAFRCDGAMVDPIRRQLLFDFERVERQTGIAAVCALRRVQNEFPRSAGTVHGRGAGGRSRREASRHCSLRGDAAGRSGLRAGLHQSRHHSLSSAAVCRAPRSCIGKATVKDPGYVLAFFDLGNVLDELERPDESIAAYQRAVAAGAPVCRCALQPGPGVRAQGRTPIGSAPLAGLREAGQVGSVERTRAGADSQAAGQREALSISWRAAGYIAPRKGMAALQVLQRLN